MSQKTCEACNATVQVKKDGDLYKHKTPDGVQCDGVVKHTVTAEPMAFSVDVDKKQDEVQIDTADAVALKKHEDEESGVSDPEPDAVVEATDTYYFSLSVGEPCLFLDDAKWDAGNKKLAAKKAKDAGLRVAGEPKRVGSKVVGRNRILRYEVPVE